MAGAKKLKDWETRERDLRASLARAERYVELDAKTLERTRAYRDTCERMLAEHLANAPVLTPKQAARRQSN